MAFWNKTQPTKSANISVNDLDKILDLLVDGDGRGAWGSAYYKGVVKKIASTVRIIPRRYTTLTGIEVPENDLPFDINVNNILAQSSTAVNRFGLAYWGIDTRGSSIDSVRWFNPETITEDYFPGRGLVGFTRSNNKEQLRKIYYKYNPETKRVDYGDNGGLGWVWSLGMNETGPGDTLDDDVGLPASLLQWADLMMETLFKRGGINKWVAFTEHNPIDDDKKRVRAALNRLLGGGVSGSSTFEVLSNLLELKQIGTNPKELGMEEINRGNKADVSAASLTPQMLINPELASNRSVIDRVTSNWLNEFVVPHAQLITDAMNHHIFEPEGYRVELQPNAMGADQQDEVERAAAWKLYVDGGANPDTVAAMLGLEVPEEMSLMLPLPMSSSGVVIDQEQDAPLELAEGTIEPAQVLNGAQITSAIQIVDAFSRGLFPRQVAVNMIVRFFNISREEAETLIPQESQTSQQKAGLQLMEPSDDTKSEVWKDERRQFRTWYTKRGIGADVSKFTAHHITEADKLEIVGDVCNSNLWGGY